jgi:hypothetical protein
MSWAWADAIPDDLSTIPGDVGELDIVAKLWEAHNQRAALAPGIGITPIPAVGADIQYAGPADTSIPASLPTSPTDKFSIQFIQRDIERWADGDTWFDPSLVEFPITATGGVLPDLFLTLASLRSQASMTSDGFRRKKPREITSLTATTDTDGNARASGQKAIFRVTDVLTFRAHPQEAGRVVKFDGTNWTIPSPPESVDVLDSHSTAPNTCAAGFFRLGDYMGGWLYREIRDALNLIYIQTPTSVPTNCLGGDPIGLKYRTAVGNDGAINEWTTAQDNAAGAWGAISTESPTTYSDANSNSAWESEVITGVGPPLIYYHGRSDIDSDTPLVQQYAVDLAAWETVFEISAVATVDLLHGIDADVLIAGVASKVGGLPTGSPDDFSDNGLAFPEDTATLKQTVKVTLDFGETSYFSDKFADATITPTACVQPTVFHPSTGIRTALAQKGMALDTLLLIAYAFPLGSYAAAGTSPATAPTCVTTTRCMRTFEATPNCALNKWDITFVGQTCDEGSTATGWTDDGTDANGHTKKKCVIRGPVCAGDEDCADDPGLSEYPPPPSAPIDDVGFVYRTYEVKPVCTGVPDWGTVTLVNRTCSASSPSGWGLFSQGSDGDVYRCVIKGEKCCVPLTDPALPAPPPKALIKCAYCWYQFKELLTCPDGPWTVSYVGLATGSPTSINLATSWTDDGTETGLKKRSIVVKGPAYTGTACLEPPDPKYVPAASVFNSGDCPTSVCLYDYEIEYDFFPDDGTFIPGPVTWTGVATCDAHTVSSGWSFCRCSSGAQSVTYCQTVAGPSCTVDADCPTPPDSSLAPTAPVQGVDIHPDTDLASCTSP